MTKSNFRGTPEERFWKYVEKTDGCWKWNAYIDSYGYGNLSVNQHPYKAHRLSYKIHKGEIPQGMCVCHKCDNPACVNPEHLWLGTFDNNNKDRASKGRSFNRSGERCPTAKLDWYIVEQIRCLYSSGDFTQNQIAEVYKISQVNVSRIVLNQTWKKC